MGSAKRPRWRLGKMARQRFGSEHAPGPGRTESQAASASASGAPAVSLKARLWGLTLVLLVAVSLAIRFFPPRDWPGSPVAQTRTVLDRRGALIRVTASRAGTRISLSEISPRMIQATLLSEDRRFFFHQGLDPLAIVRAAAGNLRRGRIISGGSTLTQQLARLHLGQRPRRLDSKLLESLTALYLEWRWPKSRILEEYFARAPYGNECYGLHAASLYYFNRPPGQLSLAQAAYLSVIPRNPNRYNPVRHGARVKRGQRRVLDRLLAAKTITPAEHTAAVEEPIELERAQDPALAAHFYDWLMSRAPSPTRRVQTTLDLDLHSRIEPLITAYIARLSRYGISNAAVVVLKNQGVELLALVGSADYADPGISGEINGALALRQPGSAVKPFTYALALERGLPTSYLIPDIETHVRTRYGDYYPHNYDEQFHGPTRLRTALGCSYNIPAVRVLEQVGENELLAILHKAGVHSLQHRPEKYGPGLTLGNGEVTLLELTRAYAALANQGEYQPERVVIGEPMPAPVRICSPQTAFLVAHILADPSARMPAFGLTNPLDLPFACAVKTGTTKNYRDNWTLGFTREYTVGVWVGNFDGRPMHGVSGVSGAGPLFRDIMLTLHRNHRPPAFCLPPGMTSAQICPLSGDLVQANCGKGLLEYFLPGHLPDRVCSVHRPGGRVVLPPVYHHWAHSHQRVETDRSDSTEAFYIDYPDEGDVFRIDPGLRRDCQEMTLRAVAPGRLRDLTWFLNGRCIGHGPEQRWRLRPGEHELRVQGRDHGQPKETATVRFRVLP